MKFLPDLSDLPETHKRWRAGRRPMDWNTFFYTTGAVAKILGVTKKRIHKYCREEHKDKFGTQFVLLDDDIVFLLKRKGRVFEPREPM